MKQVLIIGLIAFIASCSVKFHEKKFYQKGGTFKCNVDTVTVYDTIVNERGDTVIVHRDSIVTNAVIEYVPKYVLKYRYKTVKEQTKQVVSNNKVEIQQAKTDRSNVKQVEKTKRAGKFWPCVVAYFIGALCAIVVIFIINQFKEKK